MPVTRPADDHPPIPPDGVASADAPTASLAGIHSGLQRIFDAAAESRSQSQAPTQTNDPGPAEPAPDAPSIPGYTVLEHLGGGGMGDVWRVTDALDRELALKTIRVDRLTPTARDRFLAEAKAMSKVEHAHIAPIRHYQVHENTPYFLMDVYPTTLQKRLSEYQADPGKAVRLMIGVAEAVGAMHAKGYIHRDLKPGNVLIAADGTPKVSDLGLAKSLADPPSEVEDGVAAPSAETRPVAQSRTMTGAVMGTRPYMAPEQAAGRVKDANPRWDVFSLGVMLHEVLTGHRPPSSDMPELLLEDGQPDNPAPSTFKADLDPCLERVIQKCLARDEKDRYTDGTTVAVALGMWPVTDVPPPVSPPIRRWKWLVAGGFVAAAVIAAVIYTTRPTADGSDPPQADLRGKIGGPDEVPLVVANGETPFGIRVLGAQPGTQPVGRSDGLVVNTLETVLIELVPREAMGQPFELAADIQYVRQSNEFSAVGLYYAHNPDAPADAQDHTFAHFTYRERVGEVPELRRRVGAGPDDSVAAYEVGLTHWVNPKSGALPLGPVDTPAAHAFRTPRVSDREAYPVRTVRVRVTADSVSGFFDKDRPVSVHDSILTRLWRHAPPGRLPRPSFTSQGGIGLYVKQATVVFRNVRVGPVAE